jgi:hypothetical protein
MLRDKAHFVVLVAFVILSSCGPRSTAPRLPTPAPEQSHPVSLVISARPGARVRLLYSPHARQANWVLVGEEKAGANGAAAFRHSLVANRRAQVAYALEADGQRVTFLLHPLPLRPELGLTLVKPGPHQLFHLAPHGAVGSRLEPLYEDARGATYALARQTFYHVGPVAQGKRLAVQFY